MLARSRQFHWVVCLVLVSAFWLAPQQAMANLKPINIFVSILPQKEFVQRIGGDLVDVQVMVGPGQSPATYEPTPKQMAKLAQAQIYFRIGTPFENVWIHRIAASKPSLIVVDARQTVTLRDMEHGDYWVGAPAEHQGHDHGVGSKDPHIWTDPMYVKQFMRHFTDVLISLYPVHQTLFNNNYQQFAADLDALNEKVQVIFQNTPLTQFLVFHPSWGYFADRYGLTQITIELEGKTPNAKQLAAVVDYAKQHRIKRVFAQKQFSQKDAHAVAKAIGGNVVAVDPLAEDYFSNLMKVAQEFAGSMP